jgi:hypothetical protein
MESHALHGTIEPSDFRNRHWPTLYGRSFSVWAFLMAFLMDRSRPM